MQGPPEELHNRSIGCIRGQPRVAPLLHLEGSLKMPSLAWDQSSPSTRPNARATRYCIKGIFSGVKHRPFRTISAWLMVPSVAIPSTFRVTPPLRHDTGSLDPAPTSASVTAPSKS